MSRVYFHSPSGTAELRGSERAHAGVLIGNLALAVIEPDAFDREKQLRELLPSDHYLHRQTNFARSWATAFRVSSSGHIIELDGKPVDSWRLQLNTAWVIGNDALRFLVRMHAQCEVHGYVEGSNRQWLASVITTGVTSGLYRKDQGWDDVIGLLRSRDDEPVVMSYSVCEQFPNPTASDWMPPWPEGASYEALTREQQIELEKRQDAWYELPGDEQWALGMKYLRASKSGLELTPEWSEFYFGDDDVTAFDLVERLR